MNLEIADNPNRDPAAVVAHADRADAPPAGNKPQGSVGQRAKRGGLIVVFAMIAGQCLRLASNLLLTRLLVPEHFGLMALINIFVSGINLFSDLGIRQSIIQNKLGDERRFLDTAWTVQVIRGFGVWIVACLLAFPLGHFVYSDMPALTVLLPVAALSSVILGFQSTKIFSAGRHLQIGREVLVELAAGVTGLIAMAVLAFIKPTVWALVFGNLIGVLMRTVLSFLAFPGQGNRFAWDRECLGELFSFGKWIFFGTLLMFVGTNADRLILGKLITAEQLGVYNIAFMLSNMPRMLLKRLGNKVIFPAVSRKADLDRSRLREILLNRQRKLVLIMSLPVVVLAVVGDMFVRFAWDPRYHDAGWMTSLLAMGIWIAVVRTSVGPALMAVGKPQYNTYSQIARIIWMSAGAFIGYRIGASFDTPGEPQIYAFYGFLIVYALSELPPYLVTLYGRWREGLNTFWQDLWMTGVYVGVIGVLIAGRYAMGWGISFMPPEMMTRLGL